MKQLVMGIFLIIFLLFLGFWIFIDFYSVQNGTAVSVFDDDTYRIESITVNPIFRFYKDSGLNQRFESFEYDGENIEVYQLINRRVMQVIVRGQAAYVNTAALKIEKTSLIPYTKRVEINFVRFLEHSAIFILDIETPEFSDNVKAALNDLVSSGLWLALIFLFLLYKAIDYFFLKNASEFIFDFQPLTVHLSRIYFLGLIALIIAGVVAMLFDAVSFDENEALRLYFAFTPPFESIDVQPWIIYIYGKLFPITILIDSINVLKLNLFNKVYCIVYIILLMITDCILLVLSLVVAAALMGAVMVVIAVIVFPHLWRLTHSINKN